MALFRVDWQSAIADVHPKLIHGYGEIFLRCSTETQDPMEAAEWATLFRICTGDLFHVDPSTKSRSREVNLGSWPWILNDQEIERVKQWFGEVSDPELRARLGDIFW